MYREGRKRTRVSQLLSHDMGKAANSVGIASLSSLAAASDLSKRKIFRAEFCYDEKSPESSGRAWIGRKSPSKHK